MTHPETQEHPNKRRIRKPSPPGEDALSLPEFCRRNGISLALYYKLRLQGLMPAEMRIGARVLISREAAAKWRAERTADTLTTTTDPT